MLISLDCGDVIAFAVSQAGEISSRREVAAQAANYNCQTPNDCSPEELEASVRATNAAEDTVDLGLWQLALNLIGIGGLAFTVFYARKAWIESQRSADAAHETLEETRRSERRQVRAYIRVDSSSISDLKIGDTPEVVVEFVNCGQTPAHDAISWINVRVTTKLDGEFCRPEALANYSRGPVFPGEMKSLYVKAAPWTREENAAFRSGRLIIYLCGEIAYRDIFDEERYTRFNLFHDHLQRPGHFSSAPSGNEAT